MERGINTRCLHLEETEGKTDNYGALSYPIYQTATYAHAGVGKSTGYDYSRLQNPTREQLEKVVASLEGGIDAFALSSGMAAITLLMEIFKPGDHIIAEADLYGGSVRLFDNVSKKNGYEFTYLNCSRDDIEGAIKENTKAVYIETPTNPMMNVSDISKIAEIAKRHGLYLIVDNTFLSPYFQNPLKLGADIVIHSGTKFLGGQRYLSRIYRDKQRRSSGKTSVYHKDDRSRARTVRLLADLKRHQDSRNPHGVVPGECHQDRELAEGTAGCKTCILSGTSGTPGI